LKKIMIWIYVPLISLLTMLFMIPHARKWTRILKNTCKILKTHKFNTGTFHICFMVTVTHIHCIKSKACESIELYTKFNVCDLKSFKIPLRAGSCLGRGLAALQLPFFLMRKSPTGIFFRKWLWFLIVDDDPWWCQ
jgi:hypothetical protein